MYETHWRGMMRVSCERESDLQRLRRSILLSWASTSVQIRQANSRYRNMLRRGAAARELCRLDGKRFVAKGYGLVHHATWLTQFADRTLLKGAYVWHRATTGLWGLGKTHERNYMRDQSYTFKFLG